MSRYAPFTFVDILSESAKTKLPEALRITGENDAEILLLVRLLSGSLGFKYGASDMVHEQKINYFSPSFSSLGNSWGARFPKLIGEDVTTRGLASYIQTRKYANKSFYREILFEVSNFFLHRSRGANTSAFIYLYRLLERVSYCFPLIYVSMTDDFKKTYNLIKSFFGDAKDKDELGFFKTFIDTIFAGDEVLQTNVEFNFEFDGSTFEDARRLCKVVGKVVPNDIKDDVGSGDLVMAVKYGGVGRFIISLRNGFFHNLSRKDNLDTENLRDSELLFGMVNDKCLYWVASVFLAIFSYNMANQSR